MALLHLTIVLNLLIQNDSMLMEDLASQTPILPSFWGYEWHSHSYTTAKSLLISLFTHADWEHVLSNMFLLWSVGKNLFIPTESEP
jgi:membrane associated rhomboid family serine protease